MPAGVPIALRISGGVGYFDTNYYLSGDGCGSTGTSNGITVPGTFYFNLDGATSAGSSVSSTRPIFNDVFFVTEVFLPGTVLVFTPFCDNFTTPDPTMFAVYTSCNTGTRPLAEWNSSMCSPGTTFIVVVPNGGGQLWIRVGSANDTLGSGSFSVDLANGDECSTPATWLVGLSGGTQVSYDVTPATPSPIAGPGCFNSPSADLWLAPQLFSSGTKLTVSVSSTTYGKAFVGVYSSCDAAAAPLACANQSQYASVDAPGGQQLVLRIASPLRTGTVTLSVSTGDSCQYPSSPNAIVFPGRFFFNTAGADSSIMPAEPAMNNDVFFTSQTLLEGTIVTLSLCGQFGGSISSNGTVVVALYANLGCQAWMVPVLWNSTMCNTQPTVSVTVPSGGGSVFVRIGSASPAVYSSGYFNVTTMTGLACDSAPVVRTNPYLGKIIWTNSALMPNSTTAAPSCGPAYGPDLWFEIKRLSSGTAVDAYLNQLGTVAFYSGCATPELVCGNRTAIYYRAIANGFDPLIGRIRAPGAQSVSLSVSGDECSSQNVLALPGQFYVDTTDMTTSSGTIVPEVPIMAYHDIWFTTQPILVCRWAVLLCYCVLLFQCFFFIRRSWLYGCLSVFLSVRLSVLSARLYVRPLRCVLSSDPCRVQDRTFWPSSRGLHYTCLYSCGVGSLSGLWPCSLSVFVCTC
eukprot:TRINITY_DN483_c0_g1_i2.p1 TRINITY_DN483_c0_g1~~TRINITY_DN483_c0_g1_i2.p1  ORF type:complete len:685 (-),score=124.92 TRINITY_DN483_c0_g1_i2:199-2253(-)